MIYDPNKHITHRQLADKLGMSAMILTGRVRQGAGPTPNRVRVGGRTTTAYDRTEADLWVASMGMAPVEEPEDHTEPVRVERRPPPEPYTGEIVPPRDLSLYQHRKPYQPSPAMRINQDRAAALYPHRLITPRGIGNEVTFQYGFGERG